METAELDTWRDAIEIADIDDSLRDRLTKGIDAIQAEQASREASRRTLVIASIIGGLLLLPIIALYIGLLIKLIVVVVGA